MESEAGNLAKRRHGIQGIGPRVSGDLEARTPGIGAVKSTSQRGDSCNRYGLASWSLDAKSRRRAGESDADADLQVAGASDL